MAIDVILSQFCVGARNGQRRLPLIKGQMLHTSQSI